MKNKENYIRKIAIVDDDMFYAGVIADFLQIKKKERPQIYATGELFLQNIHTMPDVVLLDINLPGMSGVDLLRRIKAFDPDIYVVMLSGQQKVSAAVQSLKYGAFDYIIKDENAFKKLIDIFEKIESLESLRNNSYFSHPVMKKFRRLLKAG